MSFLRRLFRRAPDPRDARIAQLEKTAMENAVAINALLWRVEVVMVTLFSSVDREFADRYKIGLDENGVALELERHASAKLVYERFKGTRDEFLAGCLPWERPTLESVEIGAPLSSADDLQIDLPQDPPS